MPVSKKIKTCYLHIGTEKTGSSSIQHFLSKNKEKLLQEDILYTKKAGGGPNNGFLALVDHEFWKKRIIASEFNIFSSNDLKAYREKLKSKLHKEFSRRHNCNRLIISSEHFHSRLSQKWKIRALKRYLDNYVEDYKVIVYFRRQDKLACSLYSTKLKSGSKDPVLFHKEKKGAIRYYYNYLSIYQNWAGVFGAQNIIVREFDTDKFVNGDLLQDFCHAADIDCSGKVIPEMVNQSLTNEGLCFLNSLNKQMPLLVDGRPSQNREKLNQYVASLYEGKPVLSNRKQAIVFYGQYININEELNDLLVKNDNEPLFDLDFSQYPERLENNSCSYDEAVRVAMLIWEMYREPGRK